MFISMITNGAQVIICALCTFPSNANDRLLATSITHSSIMLDAYGNSHMPRLLSNTYLHTTVLGKHNSILQVILTKDEKKLNTSNFKVIDLKYLDQYKL